MSESIVRAEGKGAIASWAPTGLGVATGHDFLNKGLFEALFFNGIAQLGPATTQGKLYLYSNTGGHRELLDTYILFGDPALALNVLPADLSLTKTVEPAEPVKPGDPITYTLTYANAGPAIAFHTIISDALPALITDTVVITSGAAIAPRPDSRFAWDVADLAEGEGGTITIAGVVATGTPAGTYTNTATVAATVAGDDDADNQDAVAVIVLNVPPASADDSYTTDEDIPLTISAPGVLINDGDLNGDSLAAVLASAPTDGTLALDSDGSFTYTPAPNFDGSDAFTYRASDGVANSGAATVVITVDPVNDAPVAANDTAKTPEDTPRTVAVLGNDTDVEDDSLTVQAVSTPANGTATIRADNRVIYTPALNYNGADTFVYTIEDSGGLADTAIVSVTVGAVNDGPNAVDDAVTTPENTPVSIPVLDNDGDPDGDTLIVQAIGSPANGDIQPASAAVVYTPAPDFQGTDTFTYTISDGDLSDTATVVVAVIPAPPNQIYLPLVTRDYAGAPDLVVTSITAARDGIRVVIKNQGDRPVTGEFWVDAYIDPDPAPTAVNQPWHDLADQGLVWGITAGGLHLLEPGGELVLTVTEAGHDDYYQPSLSHVSWPLPANTPVYAQVDSANLDTDCGGVLEGHEITGGEYNNIRGPVYATAASYLSP